MREDRNFKASDVSGPSVWIFILCFCVGVHSFAPSETQNRRQNCYSACEAGFYAFHIIPTITVLTEGFCLKRELSFRLHREAVCRQFSMHKTKSVTSYFE